MNFERRYFNSKDYAFRAVEETVDGVDKKYIEGYASVFDVRSKLILENGELFYEEINRGAFDEVLERDGLDVIFTFNHDKNTVLARTISDTLKLSADDTGLFFRAEIEPEDSDAKKLWLRIKRGDIDSNSFAFRVAENDYRWLPGEDDIPVRSIDRMADLRDVSSVTYAAYPETSVSARELAEVSKPKEEEEEDVSQEDKSKLVRDKLRMKIRIIQIENKL